MTDTVVIPPEVALPLILLRVQHLRADMGTISRLDPLLIHAVDGIAEDLAALLPAVA